MLFGGKGGAFPSAPAAQGTGMFSGFMNSPIGQRLGGAAAPEMAGGTAQAPNFVQALQQQVNYNRSLQNDPAMQRRQEMFGSMGQQQPSQFSPAQPIQGVQGSPLAAFLAQLKQGR